MKLIQSIKSFVRDEEGASAVEYALILALVGLAVIGGAGALGTSIDEGLSTMAETVSTQLGGGTATPTE